MTFDTPILYKEFILLFFILLGQSWPCQSQNVYNARLVLTTIDTAAAVACYDLQISNTGDDPWDLASYNIALFYDAKAACYRSDSLVVPSNLYKSGVIFDFIGQGAISNSGLPFEDSIGFLRLNLTFVDGGVGQTISNDGGWFSTINVCFDIKFSDITDPSTCLEIQFSNTMIEQAIVAAGGANINNIVRYWISNNLDGEVAFNIIEDVIPNANLTSCFVLEEDNVTLCEDGIDNDEDGLLDCLDSDCNPGNITVETSPIDCFDPFGTISLLGGSGNLMYSIDGGTTFSQDSIFTGLNPTLYDIVITKNDVASCAFTNPIALPAPDCNETDELSCSDGLDNDGDGLIDCEDDSCLPRIDEVDVVLPFTCPLLDDGMIDIVSVFPNIEYSIDSGMTFQADPVFINLSENQYFVAVRNTNTLCIIFSDLNPIILQAEEVCVTPDEICNDGIDNDFDGLVDCLDEDCEGLISCLSIPEYYIPNILSINSPTNNIFNITSPEPITLRSFIVYDRWGNTVYHQENINNQDSGQGWNGKVESVPVASGVYIYHIELNIDGNIIPQIGDITVVN